MVEPSRASMADNNLDRSFLHRHMDRVPLHIFPHVEKPLVGAARIRHGTRRSSLGTDSLEYLQHGRVSALGSGTHRKWSGRTVIMVMAWGARCGTGRW